MNRKWVTRATVKHWDSSCSLQTHNDTLLAQAANTVSMWNILTKWRCNIHSFIQQHPPPFNEVIPPATKTDYCQARLSGTWHNTLWLFSPLANKIPAGNLFSNMYYRLNETASVVSISLIKAPLFTQSLYRLYRRTRAEGTTFWGSIWPWRFFQVYQLLHCLMIETSSLRPAL